MSRFSPIASLAGVLTLAATALSTADAAFAADWTGIRTEQDGVVVVHNPAKPMLPPVTVEPEELWRLGGDTDVEEEFFGIISRILVDDTGTVYLLDSQLNEVKAFDGDGVFLRSFGREGEGPGEFRNATGMCFLPDGNLGVLQLAPGRIVEFTLDGEPAGEFPLPASPDGAPLILVSGRRLGDRLVLVFNENKLSEGRVDITRALALIDDQGHEVRRLLADVRPLEFANSVIDETVWRTFDNRWNVGPGNLVYAPTSFQDYAFTVWDADGNPRMRVSREYEPYIRTQAEKDRLYSVFETFVRGQLPSYEIRISDTEPDIANIFPRQDGTVWVLHSRGMQEPPEGAMGVFDVFDAEGRYVREVTVRGEGNPREDGYFFVQDKLFVVTDLLSAAMAAQGGTDEDLEEDAEPMSVICYRLEPVSTDSE